MGQALQEDDDVYARQLNSPCNRADLGQLSRVLMWGRGPLFTSKAGSASLKGMR